MHQRYLISKIDINSRIINFNLGFENYMSEQNNFYQLPNTPHTEDYLKNGSEKPDESFIADGSCIEVDLHRGSRGLLSLEKTKTIQENLSDVQDAYAESEFNADIVIVGRLHETMNKEGMPHYHAINNISMSLECIRGTFLLETIKTPEYINIMQQKNNSKKIDRAA